jgi:signal transduction histidine kinase
VFLFRSLRARLIVSLVLIVVVTLLAAGVTLYARFRGYREDLTTATLRQIASPIYYNFAIPSAFTTTPRGGERLRQELIAYIRTQQEETGVHILFIDGRGRVIEDFISESSPFAGEIFFVPPVPDRGPSFEDLPEGTYRTAGGEQFLYVTLAMPQTVRRQEAGIYAVVVALPESAGPPIYQDLRQRLILAGIVGTMVALVAAFMLWLSLYRPLGRVATGVRAVARGDFRHHIPENGPTEVRALAHDVNAMSGAVQASQRTLRDFLANVSHELKTPLTSISGFSQALQDGTLETPEEQQRAARVIDVESRRLLRLVSDLLDLSRIESGQQHMTPSEVRLSELLSHVRDVFVPRAAESGVALDIDEGADAVVEADFDRIEQVLGNLLDNAFRHSSRGGAIRVVAERQRRGVVRVRVEDTGPGIAAEDLPHVFDRFYRSAGETAGSGAGLGLAIARQLVLAHGGDIGVDSPPTGGTVFWFTLQSRDESTTDQSASARPRARPATD